MNKRGISTIVATILIVLITVAAVTILWAAIYPMISKTIFIENYNVIFEIDKSNSFTVYDPANYRLSAQVKRGGDNADVVALKFVIDDNEGNSHPFKTYNVVKSSQSKVYILAVGFLESIDSVKLIPIYLVDGKEKEGSIFYLDEKIPVKDNALDDVKGNDGVEVSEGLVFYYSFDEAPKILDIGEYFVYDNSGYNHSGWIPDYGVTNNIEFIEDGQVGGAYRFDGNGDYIDFFDKQSLADETEGNKTIAFWAKPECKNDFSMVFGSFDNYYAGFFIQCPTGSMPLFYIGSGSPILTGSNIILNEWYYYVFSVLKTEEGEFDISLYIDNVLVSSVSVTGASNIDANFFVGTNSKSSGFFEGENSFSGEIDELRIYNRVLNESEIEQLYNIGLD